MRSFLHLSPCPVHTKGEFLWLTVISIIVSHSIRLKSSSFFKSTREWFSLPFSGDTCVCVCACEADLLIKLWCQCDSPQPSVTRARALSSCKYMQKRLSCPFTGCYRFPPLSRATSRFTLSPAGGISTRSECNYRAGAPSDERREIDGKQKKAKVCALIYAVSWNASWICADAPESSTPHNVSPFKAADLCSLSRAFSLSLAQ